MRTRYKCSYAFLLLILLGGICVPASAAEHYVSFDMTIDDFADDYASHPLSRSEPGPGQGLVWDFYLYGHDSDGLDQRLGVSGWSNQAGDVVSLAGGYSDPLSTGVTYHVEWIWNNESGGELKIDGVTVSTVSTGFPLNLSASDTIRIGEITVIPIPPGRSHSAFEGNISNIYIRETDLEYSSPTLRHYVSFNMTIDGFASNYASHPLSRSEPGPGWDLVWDFYLYGYNSDGLNQRLGVSGWSNPAGDVVSLAGGYSDPLSTGVPYHVEWTWDDGTGGELKINDQTISTVSPGFPLNLNASDSIRIGEITVVPIPPGRTHSEFVGNITDIYVIEPDLTFLQA